MDHEQSLHHRKVLVADDNPALAQVVRFHLERLGAKVIVARNGREAWNLLGDQTVDLIVTDHQMPEMSGGDLCLRLRQEPRLASLPVVMLTAKGLELESNWLRDTLGVTAILPKPFSPRELVEVVEKILEESVSGVVEDAPAAIGDP